MIPGDSIRQEFPLIYEAGDTLTYLDNAATTHKPRQVVAAIVQFYERGYANVHRGMHRLSAAATSEYEAVRTQLRDFTGAKSEKEIVFVRGTTEAINLVATSFLRDRLNPGDEVILSAMEHHSNLLPWQAACTEKQARLRVIPMDERGELDIEAFSRMLNPRTRMVSVVHISNSLGTLNPVKEIIQLARARGIPVLVDAAQSIGHYPLDVQDLDCDFLAFSGHKMYGPTGIGVLYGKAEHLEGMSPYQYGGEMIRSVSFEASNFADYPQKFEAGTPHIAGVIGLGEAITFIEDIGRPQIQAHIQDLLSYATTQLSEISGLRIVGQAKEKGGILSFHLNKIHPHDLATLLNEDGVAIRAGHHCTQPVMDFYGLPGTARASFSVYNTRAEVDRLISSILKAQSLPW